MSKSKDLQDALVDFFENTEKGKEYITVMETTDSRIITLNLDDVFDYSSYVFDNLLDDDILNIIEEAVTYIITIHGGNRDPPIQTIITGSKIPTMFIHEINSKYISKIIRVHGMVSRASPHIKPVYSKAVFMCTNCGSRSIAVEQFSPFFLFKPLGKCTKCGLPSPMWIPDDTISIFKDSQEFTTQENQNDIASNRIPSQIRCITYRQNCMNYVNCGDDVDVIAVVKLYRRDRTSFAIPYLEVLSIEKRKKELSEIILDKTDVERILELSRMPDVYERMVKSFAPSIYGNTEEKEAILHSIFGSPEEVKRDITIRGTIHLLMVGDPATAKSQLLRAAIKLAPKGMYALGRGTSAAGLTASLSKNVDTGEWEISAGVLVLSDEGISCIDEIDKMREEDRINVHEAMEQGTVTINKAGIHAMLRAKTAILSAANPALGKFDKEKSVFDKLGTFPPSLFSRFDLIYTLFDEPDEDVDRKVVSHIIDDDDEEENLLIPLELFRKYIIYAKKINPTLSEEGKQYLKDYFVKIRSSSAYSVQKDIPFTYRQFESLKRLTLAHARMLLKEQADMEDVKVVERLFNKFLDDIGHDVTGVGCGMGKEKRGDVEMAHNLIMTALRTNGMMTMEQLHDEIVNRYKISEKIFHRVFYELRQTQIYEPIAGKYSLSGGSSQQTQQTLE